MPVLPRGRGGVTEAMEEFTKKRLVLIQRTEQKETKKLG
jgi:hypothetical protein